MSLNLAYHYAEVDDATHMCIGVMDSSDPNVAGPTGLGSTYVEIPVDDQEYIFKFYIDGNWYEDPEGNIPWVSSML